ncbi:DNA-directed RNA polymerase, alpha subunit, partial [Toxoplasma gondii FOU]
MVWERPTEGLKLAEGEKSFAMPEFRPPPCSVHPVAWLKRELRRRPYSADGYSEAGAPQRQKKGGKRNTVRGCELSEEVSTQRETQSRREDVETSSATGSPVEAARDEDERREVAEPGDRTQSATDKETKQKLKPSAVALSSIPGLSTKALQSLHE